MDPRRQPRHRRQVRLPRASGDGPRDSLVIRYPAKAAPRERGWTRHGARGLALHAGCPARAGMDPPSTAAAGPTARLPRASGDGPERESVAPGMSAAAPRERGWTRDPRLVLIADRGCPARAGMDPRHRRRRPLRRRLPRASGDGPHQWIESDWERLAAPRERGWTSWRSGYRLRSSGCPARAGMDPSRYRSTSCRPRLPRASGDGP